MNFHGLQVYPRFEKQLRYWRFCITIDISRNPYVELTIGPVGLAVGYD